MITTRRLIDGEDFYFLVLKITSFHYLHSSHMILLPVGDFLSPPFLNYILNFLNNLNKIKLQFSYKYLRFRLQLSSSPIHIPLEPMTFFLLPKFQVLTHLNGFIFDALSPEILFPWTPFLSFFQTVFAYRLIQVTTWTLCIIWLYLVLHQLL